VDETLKYRPGKKEMISPYNSPFLKTPLRMNRRRFLPLKGNPVM
jgi:hypothetical protein